MDLTKKSMKWLVAVFVVFAMILTAVFAVGNVATASATENEYDSAVHVWATDSAELGTYPYLVVSNAARTITVKYGVAIDAASAEFFNGEFAPVLNGSKPSAIALNSAFTGIVDIEDETDATGGYLASTGAAKFFTIKSKENADISALNAYVNNEFDADKYLFSATYVLPAEATGAYTLSFASATIGNMTLPSAYALSDSESYLPVIENPNFAINAPIPVPTPADVTYIYNGGPQTFQWEGTVDGHIAITNDVQTEADTYTVNVSLQEGYAWDETGYPTAGKTFPFVINKKSVTVPSLDNSHFTYNGTSKSVSLVVLSADQGYITEIEEGSTWQATNAGEYVVKVGLEDKFNTYWGDNENDTDDKSIDWDIAKVQISIAYNKESYSTTYGNPIDTPTAVVTGDVVSGDNLNVSITGIPAAGSNAGTYPLHITYTENANYDVTAAADKNYTIKKALVEAAVTKTLANNTFTYTGEEITCEFITNGSPSYFTITGHKQTDVGTYDVTETLLDPDNYQWSHWSYDNPNASAPYVQYDTFEITKRSVAIPTGLSLTYTGEAQTGVVVGASQNYVELVSGVASATVVDNYSATYRLLSTTNTYWADNVDDVANKTVNWSIGKAQITKPTIEVSYKTYNGEAQTYSGSGTGYTFTGSGTNFGTYPVTVTLTDKDNYTWNDGTTADYEDADKLSIAKKSVTLTITKSASSSEYGSSVATITVSASGLIAENDLGTLSYQAKYSNGGSYVYYTKAEFEGTNPYPVAKSYILEQVYTANDNYYVSADSSPYTITPKAVTIAFSKASYTSVYGEPLEEISIGATGLVNAGDLGTISYVIMQNEQFVELVNVGEYSLVNTYTANPNYTVTQAGYATYTITVKQVTKPAQDNTTFTYNGSAQTYTLATNAAYTITGDTTKTNAGSNDITIALVDKTNTEWTTGGTADVVYTFTINKKAVTLDFYDSDDEEPWHLTFVATYPDSLHYITVKATGLIGANDLGELGFTATNDMTHAVADITVEGAPAGYYTLTPTYTPNANYDVTALQGTARIYVRDVIVPVVVTDTYYYDGTAKAIVFDEVASQGYSQYYTITGNSLTDAGTTTVTVALKDEYAGSVIWGYDARVDTYLDTTDDQTFTLTVNSSAIHVTFTCSYGEAVTTIAENVEVNFVTDTIRALPNFRFFYTPGWKVGGEGDVVTAYTLDMDNATLNAQFTYNVGAGDVDGNGIVNTLDLIKMKRYYIGLETEVLEDAAAAWAAAIADTAEAPVFVSALDANGSGAFRINDLVTIREALATGYDFRIVIGRQGVTGQSIENVQVLTVYEYDEFVAAVKTGIPVRFGANITAEDARFDELLDIPVDIDLNGKALTVEYFGLNSNANDVTLSIKGGTIYAFDDIVITAPNGNVKLDNVTGYNYVTDEVILAAASNSLHFDNVVEFLKYPEGSAVFADKIAALLAALQGDNAEDQAAAIAAVKEDVAPAVVNIPVDTHVVVEDNANLKVEQITVVAASNQEVETKTFSVSVKNDQASVIKVNISEVKEVVEQVNVYHVDEVALEGDTSKVEIVKAADQEVTTVAENPTYVAAIDNGTSIVFYETLVDAVAAVNASDNGGTINLLADLDFSDEVYAGYKWGNFLLITADNVTIDLNGHEIRNMGNAAIAAGHMLAVNGRISNFTIKNGTLSAGMSYDKDLKRDTTNSYVLGIGGVDGAHLKNITTNGGFNVYSGAKDVVIEDCNVRGTKYYTVCAQSGSEVIIRGTTYTKNTDSDVKAKAMFWVQGAGTEEDMITPENPNGIIPGSSITIESGNFDVNVTDGTFHLSGSGRLLPVVKGGTFNFDPSAYVADGYCVSEEDGIYTVLPGTLIMNETELNAALASNATQLNIGQSFSISTAAAADRINVTRDVILNLNGYTLTCAEYMFVVQPGATLEIIGEGTICYNGENANMGALRVMGSADQATTTVSKLIVGEDVTVQSTGYGIVIWHNNFKSYGSEVVVKGTINAATTAICPSGNIAQQEGDVVNDAPISTIAKITVESTAVLNATNDAGIYAAGFAVWDIKAGATITGASALYIKSGYLNIPNGVNLTATKATVATYKFNGNGGNVTGDGIVIDNCYYPGQNAVVTLGDAVADSITVTAEGAKKVGTYWAVATTAQFVEAKAANANYIFLKADIGFNGSYLSWNGGDLTLDLNGHTVGNTSYGILWNTTAAFTIIDSVGTGSIQGTTTALYLYKGTLTVNGGTISAGNAAIYNAGDGTIININGGTVNGVTSAINNRMSGTVNLNGGTLIGAYVIGNNKAGIINIDGATITSNIEKGTGVENQGGTINMISGSITAYNGIANFNKSGDAEAVNVTGGTITSVNYCISTNGNDTLSTIINVSGGTLVSDDIVIYNAGIGNVTVSGNAVLTGGETGIEIRAGVLTVTGGTITGLGDPASYNPNGNGATTKGAGIAVAQHTTEQAITVTISGGTISAINALWEVNPQGNSEESLAQISITVSGGTFDGAIVIADEDVITYNNTIMGIDVSGQGMQDSEEEL